MQALRADRGGKDGPGERIVIHQRAPRSSLRTYSADGDPCDVLDAKM